MKLALSPPCNCGLESQTAEHVRQRCLYTLQTAWQTMPPTAVYSYTPDCAENEKLLILTILVTQNQLQLDEDKTEVLLAVPSKLHNIKKLYPRCQVPPASMVPIFLFHLWSAALESSLIEPPPSDSIFHTSAKHLFGTQKDQFSPSLSHCWCHKNTRVFFCSVTTWLLQLSASWLPQVSSQESFKKKSQRTQPG